MHRIYRIGLTWLACFILSGLLLPQAYALNVDTPLPNAVQEARARALFYEIRCVVCQSEPIADSPADVANDMRRLVRERIAAGDSDEAIKTYLVSRYGDAVLMQPPLNAETSLLWFGPFVMLSGACLIAFMYFRKRKVNA
jgi:cytochrome c-type biogenesis protein CcmH